MSRKNWRVKRPNIEAAPDARPLYFTGGGACSIKAESDKDGKPAVPTFDGVAYTGAPMSPGGFGGQIICDLDGFEYPDSQRIPALHIHEAKELVGHTTSIKASQKTGLVVEGAMSGQPEHVDKVRGPASRDFPWQMSIGATPTQTSFLADGEKATVNGREVVGPMTIAHKTKLSEVSFVPNGADDATSATVTGSNSKGTEMNESRQNFKAFIKAARFVGRFKAAKYNDDEIDKMTEEEAKSAMKKCMAEGDEDEKKAKAAEDEKAKAKAAEEEKDKAKAKAADEDDTKEEAKANARRARIAAEEERHDMIRAAVKRSGLTHITIDNKPVSFAAKAIEAGWDEGKVKDTIELETLRASRASAAAGAGPHLHFAGDPMTGAVVYEAALLQALGSQMRLNDDAFYAEKSPDGQTSIRRVPLTFQAAAQRDFRGPTARYSDQVQQSAHTMFHGRLSMHQFFTDCMRASGSTADFSFRSREGVEAFLKEWGRVQERNDIKAAGTGTMNIANILANVLNKFALQGYLFVEMAHAMISAVRSLPDYKPSKSINLLGDVIYKELGPNGEIVQATIQDQAFANQAAPYGRMITIPWTYIVNDDLSMLATVPMKLGQGAGLKVNDIFWKLWAGMMAGTILGDDGQPFFRTTSSVTPVAKQAGTAYKPNKLAGGTSALSATSLNAVRALFENQIDPNGNPLGFDGVKPILLFGPSNWQTATALMQSPVIVYGGVAGTNLQPGNNVWQGSMTPVQSRYIENSNYGNSTTAYFVIQDPVALPIIETVYLKGIETPVVITAGPDFQFDRLGLSIRGTNDVGVAQQNFRGGVFSVGA